MTLDELKLKATKAERALIEEIEKKDFDGRYPPLGSLPSLYFNDFRTTIKVYRTTSTKTVGEVQVEVPGPILLWGDFKQGRHDGELSTVSSGFSNPIYHYCPRDNWCGELIADVLGSDTERAAEEAEKMVGAMRKHKPLMVAEDLTTVRVPILKLQGLFEVLSQIKFAPDPEEKENLSLGPEEGGWILRVKVDSSGAADDYFKGPHESTHDTLEEARSEEMRRIEQAVKAASYFTL